MKHRNLILLLFFIIALGFSLEIFGDEKPKLVSTHCSICGDIPAGQTCPHMRGSGESPTKRSWSEREADRLYYKTYNSAVKAYNTARDIYNASLHLSPQRAKENYYRVLEYLDDALRNQPEFTLALKLVSKVNAAIKCCDGQIAEFNGDFDEALRLFNEAQEIYPEGSAVWQGNIAHTLDSEYCLALDLIKKELWDEAEQHLRKVAPRYKGATAYFKLGFVLSQQGKLADAEWSYRQSIHLNPDYAVVFHDLGLVLAKQERYAEAEDAYRQAIKLDPEVADTYNSLGVTLRLQGRYEEAKATYQKALELDPDVEYAADNLKWVEEKIMNQLEAKQDAKVVDGIHESIDALITDISDKPVSQQSRSQGAQKNPGVNKALNEAYKNREGTVAGFETGNNESMRAQSALVFDTPAAVELKTKGIRPERPEWVKNNPKVKAAEQALAHAQNDLVALQARRDQMDAQRTKLINERNAAKDEAIFKAKDEELKQKDLDYNKGLLEISKQAEKIDTLAKERERIEYEVKNAGPPAAAGGQIGNQGNH